MQEYTVDIPTDRNKKWARTMVHQAVKAGLLKRQPCEICGLKYTEAHHPDYFEPLTILWLCPPCYQELHRHM